MPHSAIRDSLRRNLLEYTRIAFRMIPPVDDPSILDIGCGSGVQTIELAKMCQGHITAIDIDVDALEVLRDKVEKLGLSNRVSVLKLSMLELNSFKEAYDIIWAEGSIFVVGFENGIRDWKMLLRKDGFLVVHDEDDRIEAKLKIIEKYEYKVIGQIKVSHEDWETRYYKPLLETMSKRKLTESEVINFRKELDTFNRTKMGSIFFILQNRLH